MQLQLRKMTAALGMLGALCAMGLTGAHAASSKVADTTKTSAAETQTVPAPQPQGAAEAIAAIVNEDLITTYDVRQRMLLIIASTGIQPTEQSIRQIQDQALRSLIEERLQLQEAKKYDVKISDAEINASINAIAQQNGSTAQQFEDGFKKSGINLDGLKQQLRADMSWRRIVSGRYGSRIRVSAERVKETLARIEAGATKPQYLVSEIFLYAETPAEQDAAMKAAARLLEEMKKGAPFPVVARQFSSAPSAAVGGDLGWMRSGELRPEIESVVQNMQLGFVSDPIPVTGGVYIVALRDKRDGQTPVERVTMKGLQVPASDTASVKSLERVRQDLSNCNSIDAGAKRIANSSVSDLGELAVNDLSSEMAARIAPLQPGQSTPVFTSDGSAQIIMVCSRRKEATGVPSAEEVESRLYDQELSMVARRWLRDLRRDSTIITR